jgi:hypothetical protein
MSPDNVEVVRRALDAFNRGKTAAFNLLRRGLGAHRRPAAHGRGFPRRRADEFRLGRIGAASVYKRASRESHSGNVGPLAREAATPLSAGPGFSPPRSSETASKSSGEFASWRSSPCCGGCGEPGRGATDAHWHRTPHRPRVLDSGQRQGCWRLKPLAPRTPTSATG